MTQSHSTRRRLTVPSVACLLLLTTTFAACGDDEPSSATRTTPSRTPEERPFSARSPWNARVDALPVAANSAAALGLSTRRPTLVATSTGDMRRGTSSTPVTGLAVNTTRWTTLVVEGGAATRLHCRQQPCGSAEDRVPATLRIPAEAKPDPRYDGWMTVVQGRDAWDLWRARRLPDGTISFAFARRWSLDGEGIGVAGRSAVRGSGLPLVAGLISGPELQRGEIDHALAIALPSPATGKTVAPASSTNGTGPEGAVAEGQRLRLRAGVRLRGATPGGRKLNRQQERARDAILVALRRYGAIVVDRSAVPSLYARAGIAEAALTGDELAGLDIGDFEVVDTQAGSTKGDKVAS